MHWNPVLLTALGWVLISAILAVAIYVAVTARARRTRRRVNDSFELAVTTEGLDKAIAILTTRLAETRYPLAWRALTDERERRRHGAPALSIVLARRHLEDLPPDVKVALRIQ